MRPLNQQSHCEGLCISTIYSQKKQQKNNNLLQYLNATVPWTSNLCAEPSYRGYAAHLHTSEQTTSRSGPKRKNKLVEKQIRNKSWTENRQISCRYSPPTFSTLNWMFFCRWILWSRSPPLQNSITMHSRPSAEHKQSHFLLNSSNNHSCISQHIL